MASGTTSIQIGKINHDLPEMNFAAIERAWPYVEIATTILDPIQGVAAGLRIIAATIMESEDFDPTKYGMSADESLTQDEIFEAVTYRLKKDLKGNQVDQVRQAILAMLKDADLIQDADSGEELAGQEAANLSQETAPATSPSSSQLDAREAVGTV